MIRFRFVQDNMTELPVKRMCDLAEIPRSSFYAWLTHTPSAREIADAVLLEEIREIYQRTRNTYGVPLMVGQLRRRGHRVARSRVGPGDASERAGRGTRLEEVAAWPTRRRRCAGPVATRLPRGRPEPALGR